MGHPAAQKRLGELLLAVGIDGEEAEHWLHRAARQGSLDATAALAKRFVRSGRVGELKGLLTDTWRQLTHVSSKRRRSLLPMYSS